MRTLCGIIGWLLLSMPAVAASFGVTMSAVGQAGDACIGTYNAEENFNAGSLAANYALSYTGSAVGFDNGWPGPPGSNVTGCQFSPVFAHVNVSGSAQLGVLRATASADMETQGLIIAADRIDAGFSDTFTATQGGTFMMTVELNASETANPNCAGGNPVANLLLNFTERGPFNQQDGAGWNRTDCQPNAAPALGGNYTVINNNTVEFFESLGAGQSFTVTAGLEARAGAGFNQSSLTDAGDTAWVSVVGLNGATYSTASGTTYNFTDAPEPGAWLLVAWGLAAVGLGRPRAKS